MPLSFRGVDLVRRLPARRDGRGGGDTIDQVSLVSRLQVLAPAHSRVIVTLGDSITMEGINDIGYEHVEPTVLIDAHQAAIARARARGIKVLIATQQAVNTWIRAGEGFDGVIDFEKVVHPNTLGRLIPERPPRRRCHALGGSASHRGAQRCALR
jgi:hypothetical protein